MTEIDRRVWLPHYNARFLEWFEGIFDGVFIALHPFSYVDEMNPQEVTYRTHVFDGTQVSPWEAQKIVDDRCALSRFDADTFSVIQKKNGTPVSWLSVSEACQFPSVSKLNQVLLTTIQAVRPPYSVQYGADVLEKYCCQQKLFLPTENYIHTLLEKPLALLFEDLGYSEVLIGDEFYQKTVKHDVDALKTHDPWHLAGTTDFQALTVYPKDNSFLISASFDEFYTAICGNRKQLEGLGLALRFDGFWCEPLTRPLWWRDDD